LAGSERVTRRRFCVLRRPELFFAFFRFFLALAMLPSCSLTECRADEGTDQPTDQSARGRSPEEMRRFHGVALDGGVGIFAVVGVISSIAHDSLPIQSLSREQRGRAAPGILPDVAHGWRAVGPLAIADEWRGI
jgi:hypothetical protein